MGFVFAKLKLLGLNDHLGYAQLSTKIGVGQNSGVDQTGVPNFQNYRDQILHDRANRVRPNLYSTGGQKLEVPSIGIRSQGEW